MTSSMGPPPPPPSDAATSTSNSADSSADVQPAPQAEEPSTSSSPTQETPSAMKPPMAPPPPRNPNSSPPRPSTTDVDSFKLDSDSVASTLEANSTDDAAAPKAEPSTGSRSQSDAVPYKIPPWSGAPCHSYFLEVLKDGIIIDQLDVSAKGAYMFGRVDICDFVLEHPSISRFHAVIQFKETGDAYLYDLGSTHGSSINKKQVKKRAYVELHVGDVIRFGNSSRLYIVQGPTELMPPERDVNAVRYAKKQQELLDREASLRRAREEASRADGISWGMGEDAIEEVEDDTEEITWQNFKGELTEKQEKTRSKVLKRLEKMAHMKKEIDAIRVKDIPQGGLTQGQQTQIARNEQRISQLLEELESLEETLNDSIRESLGARTGSIMSRGKRKGAAEDEEELLSDDDDFYDRTKIKKPSTNKAGSNQSVETADTLLDKREAIMKEMEEKTKLLDDEKKKASEEKVEQQETEDALDAYMTGLSSKLKIDTVEQLQKEITTIQSELDRVLFLLKVADPTGEAAKKRLETAEQLKSENSDQSLSTVETKKKLPLEKKKAANVEKLSSEPVEEKLAIAATGQENGVAEISQDASNTKDNKSTSYTIVKPQWLGAVVKEETEKHPQGETSEAAEEGDQFVSYKDRSKIVNNDDKSPVNDMGLENAAPGLIIRKKKPVEKTEDEGASQQSSASVEGSTFKAEDAVALLLRHKRGYHDMDEEQNEEIDHNQSKKGKKDKKKPKRVLGPQKPPFLEGNSDIDSSWVPPKGQSGDGRTSLNDRLGY